MLDGKEPLVSLKWQPVSGYRDVQIYPFIRKVDTLSSNSYILKTPDIIVIIDPGGLSEQASHLAAVIKDIQTKQPRPLLIILTHAHIDHFLALTSLMEWAEPGTMMVAVQDSGAEALESADRRLTMADINERDIDPVRIDFRLLAGTRIVGDQTIQRTFTDGTIVSIKRDPPEYGLVHERILLGNGPYLDIYHTPGHSPDSCCIRIGPVLFIGDLLFSACPGVAGIYGWNQEAVILSIPKVQELLRNGGITAVCPGHGPTLAVTDTVRMLEAVLKDVNLLIGIAEQNPERFRETAAFAEDCIEQIHELFTVMAGRLYYVSYMLDELGETETGVGLSTMIKGEVIDDLLDAFSTFNQEYHEGRHTAMPLCHKGGQVIGKLQRSFDQGALSQIIDPSMVQRSERLFSDYTTMLRGFSPPRDLVVQDIRLLLKDCLTKRSTRTQSDEEVLSSIDDDAAFGRLLLARIGTPPLLEGIDVTFQSESEPLNVSVDSVRFLDLVTYLLEDLVGTGVTVITVSTVRENGIPTLILRGKSEGRTTPNGGSPRRFLFWLCERLGGTLQFDDLEGFCQYTIRFTHSEDTGL